MRKHPLNLQNTKIEKGNNRDLIEECDHFLNIIKDEHGDYSPNKKDEFELFVIDRLELHGVIQETWDSGILHRKKYMITNKGIAVLNRGGIATIIKQLEDQRNRKKRLIQFLEDFFPNIYNGIIRGMRSLFGHRWVEGIIIGVIAAVVGGVILFYLIRFLTKFDLVPW